MMVINAMAGHISAIIMAVIMSCVNVTPYMELIDTKSYNVQGSFTMALTPDGVALAQEEIEHSLDYTNFKVAYMLKADVKDVKNPKLDFMVQANSTNLNLYGRLLVVDGGVYTDAGTISSILKAIMTFAGDSEYTMRYSEAYQMAQKEAHTIIKLTDLDETDYQEIVASLDEGEAAKEAMLEVASIMKEMFKGLEHKAIVKTDTGVKITLNRQSSIEILEQMYGMYFERRDGLMERMYAFTKKIDDSSLSYEEFVASIKEGDAVLKEEFARLKTAQSEYIDDYSLTSELGIKEKSIYSHTDMKVIKDEKVLGTLQWYNTCTSADVIINSPSGCVGLEQFLRTLNIDF